MTFESNIGQFKQTQSLLFTAVIGTKNLKFEKSIQVILKMSKSENGNSQGKKFHLHLKF